MPQITAFWKDMDSRLDLIEKQQSLILSNIQDLYSALFNTKQVLTNQIQALQNQVSQLSQTVLEQGREVYRTSLQTSNNDLKQNMALAGGSDYLGVFQSYKTDVNEAYTYATSICLNTEFTGALSDYAGPSGLAFVQRINDDPDSNNLIAIGLQIAVEYGVSGQNPNSLPSPNEWARGARAFLQMNAASLRMRNAQSKEGWLKRLFGGGKSKNVLSLYQELDQQMPSRYATIRSLGMNLRNSLIGNLTGTQAALFACSGYLESFCADTSFRNDPGANLLPPALDPSLTVCSIVKQMYDSFVVSQAPDYALVQVTDPNYSSLASFVFPNGQPYGFAKATNNPFEFALKQGAITLTLVADVTYSQPIFNNVITSENKAYRVSTPLGTSVLPGTLAILTTVGASAPSWSAYPDNGQYQGSNGPNITNIAQIGQMASVFNFVPFLDATQNVLRTEYFSAQLRTGFAGYVSGQLTDSQLLTFVKAAARYKLLASFISRRFSYSDSDESASVSNVAGWFDKDDLCFAIDKVAKKHKETISTVDWWNTIQNEMSDSLRAALKSTMKKTSLCDPQRSFPAIDDTLRQLNTVAKLQGITL